MDDLDKPTALLHRFLDDSGDALVLSETTRPYRCTFANRAWEAACEASAADIIGQSFAVMQGPGTCEKTLSQLCASLGERKPITVSMINYTPTTRKPFLNVLSVAPVYSADGERLTHFVGRLQVVHFTHGPPGDKTLAAAGDGQLEAFVKSGVTPVVVQQPTSLSWCHSCRMKKDLVRCQRPGSKCKRGFCNSCLTRHHDSSVAQVQSTKDWACPVCEDSCYCSGCNKKRGKTVQQKAEVVVV